MTSDITVSTAGVRAQIWPGAGKPRCYVDPYTAGRTYRYGVYSHADLPEQTAGEDPPSTTPVQDVFRSIPILQSGLPPPSVSEWWSDGYGRTSSVCLRISLCLRNDRKGPFFKTKSSFFRGNSPFSIENPPKRWH